MKELKKVAIMKYIETENIDGRVRAIIEDKCMPKLVRKISAKMKEKAKS